MNPYLAANRSTQIGAATRIDVLLALYDGAISRLKQAHALIQQGDDLAAIPLMAKAQLIITELSAGVRLDVNAEMGINYMRLYEYIVHLLTQVEAHRISEALKLMLTLREGFEAIREEAVAMERRGEFVATDRLKTLCATA